MFIHLPPYPSILHYLPLPPLPMVHCHKDHTGWGERDQGETYRNPNDLPLFIDHWGIILQERRTYIGLSGSQVPFFFSFLLLPCRLQTYCALTATAVQCISYRSLEYTVSYSMKSSYYMLHAHTSTYVPTLHNGENQRPVPQGRGAGPADQWQELVCTVRELHLPPWD